MGNGYPSDLLKLNHNIALSARSKLALENLITVHSQSTFESLKRIGKGSWSLNHVHITLALPKTTFLCFGDSFPI